jgi:hypothetical protein
MAFACFAANGLSWYNNKSINAKHQSVQARNAVNDDEPVDIWWLDILIKCSVVNWILPELYIIDTCKWEDKRQCLLWTLVGLLEIRIVNVFSLEHTK